MSLLEMMLRPRLGRIFERKLAQSADKLEFFARGVQLRVMVEILALTEGSLDLWDRSWSHLRENRG